MRKLWIGAACLAGLLAGLALAAAPLSAQQRSSGQPAIMEDDQPDQATPPAPPAKPSRRARATTPINPDLDTDDQLAPSQMKQPMPAPVAEPGSAPAKPARPVKHAATDPPAEPHAAPARPAAMRPGAHVVACSGPFARDSGMLALAMAYDSRNVTFTEVDVAGTKVGASILFPKDPKSRLEVWWSNANRTGTYLILINGQSTWTGPGGLHLGLNLAQLEKLNHKPFKIKGFDKDGVASVSDWDGGALAGLPGGCKAGLNLHADAKASADAVKALPPEREFASTDPAFRDVKPTVAEILIGY
jgi:hypothetical protein